MIYGPVNLAIGPLVTEHKINRPGHHREKACQKILITCYEEVVPDPGRNVSDVVRFSSINGRVGMPASITGPPTAVVELLLCQPPVSPLGCTQFAGNAEAHGRLCVIPRIGMATIKPGNLAIRSLRGEQKLNGGPQPLRWVDVSAQKRRVHNA